MQRSTGVTSIVVTHSLECAFTVADRVGMMAEGTLIEVGSPEAIRRSSNPVVRRFLEGEEGPDMIRMEESS